MSDRAKDSQTFLEVTQRQRFHTVVAKILYLVKRPDLLLVTSFLASRVKQPTEQDTGKVDETGKVHQRDEDTRTHLGR
jgi:hypothetical protein